MIFLVAVVFLIVTNACAFFLTLGLKKDGTPPKLWLLVGHMLTTVIGVAAVIIGAGFFANPEHSFRPSFNWSVPLFFALGLISATLFGWKLGEIRSCVRVGCWRKARYVLVLLTGVYIVGTVIDHWWFFRNSADDKHLVGTASAHLLGADDIKCDEMVLMRIEEDGAQYRCPEFFVWGGSHPRQPFVPWPTYREGMSVKLKAAIEALETDAADKRSAHRQSR